ncbi:MAG: tRNA-dihydrouridine synthase [Ignavibacteriales bacterium]|nr:tRNA-dihydrouridine synthase [Ignavibacteriales bacterium]
MSIQNLNLQDKLILAPMADITDSSFRTIAREYGAGLTYTQMVSAKGVVENDFNTLRYLAFQRSEKPIAVQLITNDPVVVSEAIDEIIKYKPDVIDLNSSCPSRKITQFNMGAALLDNQQLLAEIIKSMVDSAKGIPVSVKLRLCRKNIINVVENAKIAEDNGASFVIIHGRSEIDSYSKPANWQWIKEVVENISIPAVGNGSVFTPVDAIKMKEETGCFSVMIGRGAIGNPFIFKRYDTILNEGKDSGLPSIQEIVTVIQRHIKYLKLEWGEFVAFDKAKRLVLWYFKYYTDEKLIEKILAIKDFNELHNLIAIIENEFKDYLPSIEDEHKIDKLFRKKVVFWNGE